MFRKRLFSIAQCKNVSVQPGVPIFVEHWGGDNLQFYSNFALFSTLRGMNLDHDFFQVSNSSEDQKKWSSLKVEHFFPRIHMKTKKKVFIKYGTLFSPNSSGDLRSDAHRRQIFGGDTDEAHTQIIGKDISPPSPTGFGTPVCNNMFVHTKFMRVRSL